MLGQFNNSSNNNNSSSSDGDNSSSSCGGDDDVNNNNINNITTAAAATTTTSTTTTTTSTLTTTQQQQQQQQQQRRRRRRQQDDDDDNNNNNKNSGGGDEDDDNDKSGDDNSSSSNNNNNNNNNKHLLTQTVKCTDPLPGKGVRRLFTAVSGGTTLRKLRMGKQKKIMNSSPPPYPRIPSLKITYILGHQAFTHCLHIFLVGNLPRFSAGVYNCQLSADILLLVGLLHYFQPQLLKPVLGRGLLHIRVGTIRRLQIWSLR